MKPIVLAICLLSPTAVLAAGSSGGNSGGGYSSDGSGSSLNVRSEIRAIKALLSKEKYRQASRQAQAIINQDWYNADAWNLMGFSQRKMGNYKKSGKAYARALKFDPEHKGALEYQGELFIKLGELDKAFANQRILAELCPNGCEQLDDLTAALAGMEN